MNYDEIDNNGSFTYHSSINPEYIVSIIFKNFEYYNQLRLQLNELDNSIGALMTDSKTIIIDGEQCLELNLNRDAILCIEAHEIAHSLLNHPPGIDLELEKEADVLALGLLHAHEHVSAAKMLETRMQQRYKISYD